MRHQVNRLRLNQKPDHARLLKRNVVTSILLYESIRTTKKRALVVSPIVENLISIAKTKDPQIAIRAINRVVTDKNASRKLMEVLRKRYANRQGGYTTIKAAGSRKGDGADVVDFALVDAVIATPVVQEKPTAKKKPASKPETKKMDTESNSPKKSETSTKKSSQSSASSKSADKDVSSSSDSSAS